MLLMPLELILLENIFQRCVNAFPLDQQLFEDQLAVGGETVEPLFALVFFSPLADQQALSFKPAKQWVESALINSHAVIGQRFAERVAVVLGPQGREHRKGKTAPAKLLTEVFEAAIALSAGRHTVYDIYYISHSI